MEHLTSQTIGGTAVEPYAPYHPAPARPGVLLSAEVAAERHNREAAVARRVLRAARPSVDQAVYEVTKDPGYLKQYYILRERMYVNVWGLENFNGDKDEYDDVSDVIIARIGRQVIGGIRLTVSTPQSPRKLSMETENFKLPELLPDLHLQNLSYGEYSRLAVLPEFQYDVTFSLCSKIAQKSVERGISYGFAVGPVMQVRNYRRVSNLLGVPSTIRSEIEVKPKDGYEGKMGFVLMDFTEFVSGKIRLLPEVKLKRTLEEAH